MIRPPIRRLAVALILLTPALLSGRQAAPPAAAPAVDMVDRIFKTREFSRQALQLDLTVALACPLLLLQPLGCQPATIRCGQTLLRFSLCLLEFSVR